MIWRDPNRTAAPRAHCFLQSCLKFGHRLRGNLPSGFGIPAIGTTKDLVLLFAHADAKSRTVISLLPLWFGLPASTCCPANLFRNSWGDKSVACLRGNQKLYTLVPANSGAFGYANFEYFRFSADRDER
jgi:hypothetical protein